MIIPGTGVEITRDQVMNEIFNEFMTVPVYSTEEALLAAEIKLLMQLTNEEFDLMFGE